MTLNSTEPKFLEDGFRCPHCNVDAHQVWSCYSRQVNRLKEEVLSQNLDAILRHLPIGTMDSLPATQDRGDMHKENKGTKLYVAICQRCYEYSVWVEQKDKRMMVFPDSSVEPLSEHVNEDIRDLYREAASIYTRSRRAATALLRLVIEKLCKRILGLPDDSPDRLNDMIKKISKEFNFDPEVIKAMKNTKSLGDKAAHGGVIDLDDPDEPSVLFWLVRYIVQRCIVDDIEAKRINKTIEKSRQQHEKKGK